MMIRKIGLVVAVEESAIPLLWGPGECVGMTPFGEIRQYRNYLTETYVEICGAGEIRAAAATQHLIDRYRVDMVANYGVVGACNEDLKVCETCVVSGVAHYDYDLSAIDEVPVGRYEEYAEIILRPDTRLLRICKSAYPDMRQVICASGDKFLDFERKKLYGAMFGADICDMEAAGILLTCHRNGVPCLLIKTVADGALGGGTEYWDNKDAAAETALRVLQTILRRM